MTQKSASNYPPLMPEPVSMPGAESADPADQPADAIGRAYQRDHEKAVRAIEVAAEFTPELKAAGTISPASAIDLLAYHLAHRVPSEAPTAESKPTSRIGGSLLPSSEPRILQPMQGPHGTFQVRPLPELDTYGLFFNERQLLAMHPNGYSCHNLAERILAVWAGSRKEEYALAQFDYILTCGGLGANRGSIEFIARGLPKD